ncbi:MAG TPA: transcriptional regulator [Xanthobacteraceae bacterium]|nr:transcriptional regulator [Xanthobacteraceae bacterium]
MPTAKSFDDYQVLRWDDWCASKGFSRSTGDRIRKSGKGPRVVQLGERAIGVTRKDDREWTEARIKRT